MSVGALLAFFYNVVVSWSIWYFFTSITSFPLDWSTCSHDFNTEHCYSKFQEENQCASNNSYSSNNNSSTRNNNNGLAQYLYNNSCISLDDICDMFGLKTSVSDSGCLNGSLELHPEVLLDRKSSSVEEFWHKHVLGDAEQYNWENFVRKSFE